MLNVLINNHIITIIYLHNNIFLFVVVFLFSNESFFLFFYFFIVGFINFHVGQQLVSKAFEFFIKYIFLILPLFLKSWQK